MSSPGMVFIVGMERCHTTSLAQWLVDAELCDWFVDGIKEPAMFASDPDRALARWERERHRSDRWLLDASVCYAWPGPVLEAIANLHDYRVVVCFRDQFERTLSAYRLYRALYGIDLGHAWLHPMARLKFGDLETRDRLRSDPLAPATVTRKVDCRYVYTLIKCTEIPQARITTDLIGECDGAYDVLERQSLAARIVYEWQQWTRKGAFPPISILGNSSFAAALAHVLDRLDPAKVAIATPGHATFASSLPGVMGRFLGAKPTDRPLQRLHASSGWGFEVDAADVARARKLVADEFQRDSEQVRSLIDRTLSLECSLFHPEALFGLSVSDKVA